MADPRDRARRFSPLRTGIRHLPRRRTPHSSRVQPQWVEDVYPLLPKRVSPEQEAVSPLHPQKKTNINTHNNKNKSKRSAPVPSHLPGAPGWFTRSRPTSPGSHRLLK